MSEQPSTEVAAVEAPQVVEHRGHLSEQMRYAQALAAAGLLPPAYRRQPANVLLAMEYAKALNIPVMTAIQGVHVIDGKPSASAGLISALVRKAGHRLRVTGDDTRAVCEIVRHDDPDFTFRAEWTLDRAKAAKLLGIAKDAGADPASFPDDHIRVEEAVVADAGVVPDEDSGIQGHSRADGHPVA